MPIYQDLGACFREASSLGICIYRILWLSEISRFGGVGTVVVIGAGGVAKESFRRGLLSVFFFLLYALLARNVPSPRV